MVPVGVAYFLLLSSLGLVITAQAQSCSRPAGGHNMVLKDSDITRTSFPDGSTATFACEIGYKSAGGSRVITCSAGTWSVVVLKCERKSCGNPGQLDNGRIEYVDGDMLFGDIIRFTCNTGFNLVGKRLTVCRDKGWFDRLPVCEVVKCLPPPNIENGVFTDVKENYNYGEVIQYKCDRGLTLNGSRTRSCSEDETFKPNPPTCIKVLCENVVIENAEWTGGSRPPFGHLASVTYKCKTGYGNEATHFLTCGLDSKWSPELPTCEPNKVPSPPPTTVRPPTTVPPPTTKKVPSPPPTTVRPPTTKKVPTTGRPPTAVPPGSGGTKWWQSWWFIIVAIICSAVLIACGCRYCGCLAFIKNKRGSRGGYSGNVTTKDEDREL